jgi:SM-20-related protein
VQDLALPKTQYTYQLNTPHTSMKQKGFATTPVKHKSRSQTALGNALSRPDQTSDQISNQAEAVTVTILLAGGQQYTVTISPNDSLLRDLYDTMMAIEPVKRLFQISINQGQAMLAFPSDRLVGVITDPPLLVEHDAIDAKKQTASQNLTAANPLVSEYLQLDHFLTVEEHQSLLDYVAQRQADFVGTTTFTGAVNYRESVVLYSFPEFTELITHRIQKALPEIFQNFNLKPFQISQIESQLTAHNDGNFYKIHNDNGSQDTATRELTYVYYFYRQPKPFTGGELLIYDSKVENNYYVQAETYHTIEPRNNSIVFFLSRYMHEVLPIRCPSQQFADSRFTINGWIRR